MKEAVRTGLHLKFFISTLNQLLTYSKNTVRISKSNDLETIFKISILSFVTPLCLFLISGSKLYTFSETTKYLITNLIYFFSSVQGASLYIEIGLHLAPNLWLPYLTTLLR